MIIFEILGEILLQIIFEGIILGFFRLFAKGYDGIKYLLFGVEKSK